MGKWTAKGTSLTSSCPSGLSSTTVGVTPDNQMEIPHRQSMYPEVLIKIDRINIRHKQVHFLEEKWLSSDLVLFDPVKARELVRQYNQFELNFSDLNFFEKINKERRKHVRVLNRESGSEHSPPEDSWEGDMSQDWISNYFYPLNVSELIRGAYFFCANF